MSVLDKSAILANAHDVLRSGQIKLGNAMGLPSNSKARGLRLARVKTYVTPAGVQYPVDQHELRFS
jgi:hypothetical protein